MINDLNCQREWISAKSLGFPVGYICERDSGSIAPPQPPPVSPTPKPCTIESIRDFEITEEDIQKGNSKKALKFWTKNIINTIESDFNKAKFGSCKYDGDFDCANFQDEGTIESKIEAIRNLAIGRLGACGTFKKIEKRLMRFQNMFTNIKTEKSTFEQCTEICSLDGDLFKTILPILDLNQIESTPHRNKFKFDFIKRLILMNIRQNTESCSVSAPSDTCTKMCSVESPAAQVDLVRSHAEKSFEKCSFLTSEFSNPLDRLECLLCNAEGSFQNQYHRKSNTLSWFYVPLSIFSETS